MFLISEAIKYNKYLSRFVDLGGKLTSQYIDERYPFCPITEFSPAETSELLEETQNLIEILKEGVQPT